MEVWLIHRNRAIKKDDILDNMEDFLKYLVNEELEKIFGKFIIEIK